VGWLSWWKNQIKVREIFTPRKSQDKANAGKMDETRIGKANRIELELKLQEIALAPR